MVCIDLVFADIFVPQLAAGMCILYISVCLAGPTLIQQLLYSESEVEVKMYDVITIETIQVAFICYRVGWSP